MKRLARLFALLALLVSRGAPADEGSMGAAVPENFATTFPYTLAELEDMIDTSPQVQLLQAKQEETRRKESIWHDISISAGFNPVRTADQFTDRIRVGFAESMPLDILLFRVTSRVSREMEGLEVQKASTLLIAQDASLDTVKEAEVTVSRIEAGVAGKHIDVHDLEDGMLTLVGKQ